LDVVFEACDRDDEGLTCAPREMEGKTYRIFSLDERREFLARINKQLSDGDRFRRLKDLLS
jgi:hypothetical protein